MVNPLISLNLKKKKMLLTRLHPAYRKKVPDTYIVSISVGVRRETSTTHPQFAPVAIDKASSQVTVNT